MFTPNESAVASKRALTENSPYERGNANIDSKLTDMLVKENR